ncbi:MAG TPA: hypothetical protein VMP10_04470, partial [Chloroflexota bacterium]|nr:hypothetical protein [Chloroflexota bacterium]
LYLVPLVIPLGVATGYFDLILVFYVFIGLLISALVALLLSYRHSPTPLAHAQLKWIFWGLAVFVLAQVVGTLVPATAVIRIPVLPPAPFTAAFALFPISIGFAVLRYRLWDIDIIINRTIVYTLLTMALVVIYLGAVVLLQQIFNTLTSEQSDMAVVISTLAIAALFSPLRRRVQSLIDRRLYRRRYDAARTLASFSATVRDEVDLSRLTSNLKETVEETIQPAHVSLWLRKPERDRKA